MHLCHKGTYPEGETSISVDANTPCTISTSQQCCYVLVWRNMLLRTKTRKNSVLPPSGGDVIYCLYRNAEATIYAIYSSKLVHTGSTCCSPAGEQYCALLRGCGVDCREGFRILSKRTSMAAAVANQSAPAPFPRLYLRLLASRF